MSNRKSQLIDCAGHSQFKHIYPIVTDDIDFRLKMCVAHTFRNKNNNQRDHSRKRKLIVPMDLSDYRQIDTDRNSCSIKLVTQ